MHPRRCLCEAVASVEGSGTVVEYSVSRKADGQQDAVAQPAPGHHGVADCPAPLAVTLVGDSHLSERVALATAREPAPPAPRRSDASTAQNSLASGSRTQVRAGGTSNLDHSRQGLNGLTPASGNTHD